MAHNTFYMVYLENQNTPSYKHSSMESAVTEAKRLAREHKRKAYVLVTVKSFEIMEYIEEDCRPEHDDLPF